MGIDLAAFEFLLRSHQRLGDFGRTLTLGRQRLLLRDEDSRKRFAKVLASYRPDLSLDDIEHRYVDRLIECLGGKPSHFLDNSAYEGAQVIHDLNEPLPPDLAQSYDTVIDIGLLEHVFNIGTGMKCVAEMVAPGGRFLCLNVANHHLGHGFWQFSPEVFFRTFCPAQGYQPEMADLYYGGQFHPLRDPEVAGRRLPIATPGYTYITFAASRTEVRPIFLDGWPVQADYQAAWIIFQARKAWESDNAAEAQSILRDAHEKYPANPLYLAELARIALRTPGQLAEADALSAKAFALADDNPAVMKGREAVLEALRRTKPAVDLQPTGSVATPLSAPEVVPAMAAAGSVAATSSSVAGPVPATIEIGGITLAFDDPRVPEATRAALTKGRYEFKERELARRVLRRGDRVIELGSGMGVVSLIMARLIGAEAVMTFEANPGIVELTRANAERNGLPIMIRNAIAGPRATTESGSTMEFFALRAFEASSTRRTSPGQKVIHVPAEILEDAIEKHHANVLMMDIEGFEEQIISHADLGKIERLIMETHPKIIGVDGVVALAQRLESQGLGLRRDLIFGDVMAFDRATPAGRDTAAFVEQALALEPAIHGGELDRARNLVAALAAPMADNAYFHHRRAQLAKQFGEDPLPAAEQAAALDCGDFLLYELLCGEYLHAGQHNEAKDALTTLERLFPRSQNIERLRARAA